MNLSMAASTRDKRVSGSLDALDWEENRVNAPRKKKRDSSSGNRHAPASAAILSRIEQPTSIRGRKWFFARGYSGGFGAEYGPTLDKRTVAARCARKTGAGKLVNINGAWYWLQKLPE